MRVIKRGPAFLGDDAVSREFAGSLRAADLAEATRRGYTADLGKFRAWIEERRGTTVALRRISAADLSSYRQHRVCPALAAPPKAAPAGVSPRRRNTGAAAGGRANRSWIGTRNYALVQLMIQTGLRVGEVSQLLVADCQINNRSGLVRVRAGKRGQGKRSAVERLCPPGRCGIPEDEGRV